MVYKNFRSTVKGPTVLVRAMCPYYATFISNVVCGVTRTGDIRRNVSWKKTIAHDNYIRSSNVQQRKTIGISLPTQIHEIQSLHERLGDRSGTHPHCIVLDWLIKQ